MNLSNLLDFQAKYAQRVKMESALNASAHKKNAQSQLDIVNSLKERTVSLDNEAAIAAGEYEKLSKTYEDTFSSLQKVLAKNIDDSAEAELASLSELSTKITNNLSIIEKRLQAVAGQINQILQDYNQTRAKYKAAGDKYKQSKADFEAEQAETAPKLTELDKELKAMEKGIDAEILTKYKAKTTAKIFPVLVPLRGNSCGGCGMELSTVVVGDIKKQSYADCEHCRKIVYGG